MLRFAVTVLGFAFVLPGTGWAQERLDPVAPLSDDYPAIDFVLRPTQDIESGSDEFWQNQLQPDPPALTGSIGPAMAGPTGDEPIGPPLLGPVVIDEPLASPQDLPQALPGSLARTPAPVVPETVVREPVARDEDPFAPIGFRSGAFIIRPSIETGVVATDNAGGGPDRTAAVGFVAEPELDVRAEDERYQLQALLRGTIVRYDEERFDDRSAEARVSGRYALTSLTSIDGAAAYTSGLESFTDPDTPAAAAKRPAVDAFEGTLGVTRQFGRLAAGVHGFARREIHEDVTLVGGGTAARDELDYTEYGGRFRAGYLVSAALTPFTEVALARREFDRTRDNAGVERSSVWGELRGGIALDLGSRLSGEASLGYRHEDMDDPGLEDIDAFVADASLLWSPHRLTGVALVVTTQTRPTTLPGASASILYAGTLTLTQRLAPRITGNVGVGIDEERYVGIDSHDTTLAAFAGVSYAFNRVLSVKASYAYERTESDDPGRQGDANVVGVRVRIQR